MYAIRLGQTVPTLTSALKEIGLQQLQRKRDEAKFTQRSDKVSQAKQVVLGLLDISLCNNFATSNEWLWSKDETTLFYQKFKRFSDHM